MKKRLAIAALLAVITLSCAPVLAQAADNAAAGIAADREAMPDVSLPPDNASQPSPADKVEMDRGACAEQADAIPGKSGDGASDEEIATAFKACMKAKHYTDAQLKEQESEGEEDTGSGSEE